MSQPTRGDVHVNRPLTNISIAFIQSADDFIANKVFPAVPVMKQSDRYFQYDRKQWRRSDAKKRGPGTESAGSGFTIDNTPTYFADVFALHTDISDQIRANQDQPIDLDRDGTRFVAQQCMIKKEQEFVAKFLKTGLWTGSSTGTDIVPGAGNKWDDSTSDPVAQVDLQKRAMKRKTGFAPNKLVVTPEVHSALKNNANIIDRIKHTQRGVVTRELLAAIFEVDQYLVAEASQDSTEEGEAAVDQYIWNGEQALLCYANPTPSILTPSAGYIFSWRGMFGAGAEGTRIKRFRMEHLESDRIECEMAWDMKRVAADLGVFFDDLLV